MRPYTPLRRADLNAIYRMDDPEQVYQSWSLAIGKEGLPWVGRILSTSSRTDQRKQFSINLCKSLRRLNGSKATKTTVYYPQASGSDSSKQPFDVTKHVLKSTSSELVCVGNKRLQSEFLGSPAEGSGFLQGSAAIVSTDSSRRKKRYFILKKFANSKNGFLRHNVMKNSLQTLYDGTFKIVSRGKKIYVIHWQGKHPIVSINRLKPAHVLAEQVAVYFSWFNLR